MAGIYVHIPFCKQACHYCDFHFSTNLSRKTELFQSLVAEVRLQCHYLSEPVKTIYLGGGTPSLADHTELTHVLDTIRSEFEVTPDAEVTLEANPDDMSAQRLAEFRAAGINRLSIGVQSFDDRVLTFLNRAHNSNSALECIPLARAAGFQNISIDLIYAIPTQTKEQWITNVKTAIQLQPEHISAYSLTIEEKTVFGNWSAKGKLTPVDEEMSATQFDELITLLEEARYEQYEISNFARPGFHSRHNSSYWQQEKYLGIGPGAHSYNGHSRQFNVANNHLYIAAITEGKVPSTIEHLSARDRVNDYLLTTLRTSWGSDLEKLKHQTQYDLLHEKGEYVASLVHNGLATLSDNHLRLTRRGRFLADKISSDLFIVTT